MEYSTIAHNFLQQPKLASVSVRLQLATRQLTRLTIAVATLLAEQTTLATHLIAARPSVMQTGIVAFSCTALGTNGATKARVAAGPKGRPPVAQPLHRQV